MPVSFGILGRWSVNKAFEKHAKAMLSDWNQVFVRRVMWAEMESRIRTLFKDVESSPKADFFGGIHIHSGTHPNSKKIHVTDRLNQLQITCLTRPLGITTVEETNETRVVEGQEHTFPIERRKLHVESGACLWFSQSPSGGVTVFMSPYKSDLVTMNEKEIVIGMYKDPSCLTNGQIRKLFRRFFKYRHITSALHNHTALDYAWRLWLTYQDVRNRKVWKTFVAINVLVIFGGAFFTILGYLLKP